MGARQRLDAALDRMHIIVDALGAGEPDDRLDHCQRITGAVIDFARQQDLALVGLLAVGDVDSDPGDTDHLAGAIDARGRSADAPAYFAVRTQHAVCWVRVPSAMPRAMSCSELQSSGWMSARILSAETLNVCGSTPKMRC